VETEHERSENRLSDSELESIAKRAAEIVETNFQLQVGKVTLRITAYVVGAAVIALLGWLGLKEGLK